MWFIPKGKGGLKQENENLIKWGVGGEDLQGCLNRIKRYLISNMLSNKDRNYSTRKRIMKTLQLVLYIVLKRENPPPNKNKE